MNTETVENDYTATPSPRAARDHILGALAAFAATRPGLEYGNYGDPASYRAEVRGITKDLHHARALLTAVRLSGITESQLATAFRSAFSGRLSWDGERLDYCTGQYYPTEYRRAVCAVLAAALWAYFADCVTGDSGDNSGPYESNITKGDKIRAAARRELPRAIVARWFN
tara:strand:+ start:598 stop:1107 length:510 start_codon:yes stop_codon:yes gene_type:complete